MSDCYTFSSRGALGAPAPTERRKNFLGVIYGENLKVHIPRQLESIFKTCLLGDLESRSGSFSSFKLHFEGDD